MHTLPMLAVIFSTLTSIRAAPSEFGSFQMICEFPLADHGGVPFPVDLNGNGCAEVLWLQSPGLFHAKVFDAPPWQGRFTEAERDHFCLTATDARGEILWRVGEPWTGDRPFVSHSTERALDFADLDGDGIPEIVCIHRNELLVLDGRTGAIKRAVEAPADNAQIVQIGRTGHAPERWTILVKNSESAYPPHEYANPAWFYNATLELLKTSDYLGAGHAPMIWDLDGDGLDEFVIGFNTVDGTLETRWTCKVVPDNEWDVGEMHVDYISIGEIRKRRCIALAASDMQYLIDAERGQLIWKYKGEHPQCCAIGSFHPDFGDNQVIVHNKRADLQLLDANGNEVWRMTPPLNFPLGQAAPCKRQAFHTFDPLTVLQGMGPAKTDMVIFTDAGWPYVIDGLGRRRLEFPYTQNAAQDWGQVPGRPDDYGYGYYARIADFDGDRAPEIMISDRRFAWVYEMVKCVLPDPPSR